MNQEAPTPQNRTFEVEFYPSAEDQIHIATTVAKTVPATSWHHKAYSYYIFLNLLIAPVFFWINEYFIVGAMIFLLNFGMIVFFAPRIEREGFRKYYEYLLANREKSIAKIQISETGLWYFQDGGQSFWPWKKFSRIEENNDSIYLYYDGNGIAIRKNGFAYKENEREFFQFLTQMIGSPNSKLIGTS